MIVVSACLAGEKCRYDGGSSPDKDIIKLVKSGEAISICPEEEGGLSSPRAPAEISGGDGYDVLDGKARVINIEGKDMTEDFIRGAERTLETAKKHGIKKAVLKKRSPSCGMCEIYDGNFRCELKKGDGVTAALLMRNGIEVFNV